LDARIQKLNGKGMVLDRVLLSYQLIEPVFRDDAISLRVRVHSMILSWSLPIDGYAKADRLAVRRGAKHHMEITRMETKDDLSSSRLEHGNLAAIEPLACESPIV
jgi:hypothetical protein